MKNFSNLQEDLRKWFSKTDPAGDWKRINSKGEVAGPCAREPGEPKPKCMSRAKRESLTKKERASAVRAKRKYDPDPERKGEPINVSNFGKGKISENMENLEEKNVPTNPSLWSQAKSLARSKFDVYPSAYANGWASKWYKGKGGSWKSVSEETLSEAPPNTADAIKRLKAGKAGFTDKAHLKAEGLLARADGTKRKSVSEAMKDKYDEGEYDQEGDMAKSDLRSIMANAKELHDMIDDADNLPEWCQNKITLAEDYISTVANYMTAEMSEEIMQEGIKDEPHEIVHKDTGKTVSTHKNYKDAYSAYQDLSKASDHAIGHITKKTNEDVEPITELSSETLDRYKDKAKKSSDSLTSQGKYRQANDRTMNVMKATGKQIDKTVANIRKSLNNDSTPAQRSLQPNNKTMVRESRRLEIVREAMVDAKKKDQKKKMENKLEMNGSDKFQAEPELSNQVIKNNV